MPTGHHRPRVGLLGGSFNPPHVCHVLSSVYWLETADLSEVWWLPVFEHAFDKGRTLAPWADRLAMCEAAVAPWPRLRVDPVESTLTPPSRTLLTVNALRERHPDVDFAWILGSDLLDELPRWHRWDELRDAVDFLVLGRGPGRAPPPLGRFDVRDFALPDVSSSAIRRDLAAGRDVRDRLPAGVAAWLAEHPELYR
jgi:nicotinate-nucleotide adenylyltransferase